MVSISSLSKVLCSGINESTHFCLLKLEGTTLAGLALALALVGLAFGAPKNDVMLPLVLVFLLSVAGDLRWPASRLVPAGLDIVRGVSILAAVLVVKVTWDAAERKVGKLDAGEKSMGMLLEMMGINFLRISFRYRSYQCPQNASSRSRA